jgi:hypothetical protein
MVDVLSAAELWVLSYAVEAKMPVGIYGSPNFGHLLNCNASRFTIDQVSQAIRSLFESKLVALGQESPASRGLTDESSVGDLDAKLREHRPFVSYLWLTPRGGASWEGYVQPDWSKFILEERDEHGRVVVITCQHEGLIARYRHAMQEALRVDQLEASEDAVGSWAATYWKTLMGGKRVQFAQPSRELQWPEIASNGYSAMCSLSRLWRQVGSR